jgi:MFS-type transporter involved in bile tolerance (Atg22 family)
MGWVGVLTGSARLSILSVGVLFIVGGVLLSMVDVKAGEKAAQELE